jgi:phosphoribosyl 1,2-cyclic phosphodiesterase
LNVTFYGVRGSTPVAGQEFLHIGGHTSCIAIAVDNSSLPTLVLDAGTGLQSLARIFDGRPFAGAILLTHLHWDHVQGLPFFPPADRDDARTTLAQPAQGEPIEVLARAMSPPHFPIRPDELDGIWTHVALEAGNHRFDAFDVVARDFAHKGGRTFGYRVASDRGACVYVPDALDDNDDALCELAADADVFVRGTPFVSAEAARAAEYGHGTAEHAAEIARRANVRRLVLTHHGPTRSDDAVDKIAARVGALAAYEGMTIEI